MCSMLRLLTSWSFNGAFNSDSGVVFFSELLQKRHNMEKVKRSECWKQQTSLSLSLNVPFYRCITISPWKLISSPVTKMLLIAMYMCTWIMFSLLNAIDGSKHRKWYGILTFDIILLFASKVRDPVIFYMNRHYGSDKMRIKFMCKMAWRHKSSTMYLYLTFTGEMEKLINMSNAPISKINHLWWKCLR